MSMSGTTPEDATGLDADELRDAWPALAEEDRAEGFRLLAPADAEDFFLGLDPLDAGGLLLAMPLAERQIWMRQLAPDDAADVLQEVAEDDRDGLFRLLDDGTRREVTALLAYAEDDAGGLMSPRYVRLRPDMSVDEAISYLRRQARERVETIYYIYVLDADQCLLGVVSFRDLFAAQSAARVRDVMTTDVLSAADDMDQEALSNLFAEHDLMAVPIVDGAGRMQGIVTIDDIVDVVREEATEDIQKIGGTEALDAPYLQTTLPEMVRKRGGWLGLLFVGELLTATAMSRFEDEIAKAVVLALFIPLIISSGGNSGSQASTLVIRALAVGDVRLRDWWRVMKRELVVGFALGAILGGIGAMRILFWPGHEALYGEHYVLLAATVSVSLVGIVLWGALSGSMLPFVLSRVGLDPASASAPFVATLVDVTGIVLYFSVAMLFLRGTLL